MLLSLVSVGGLPHLAGELNWEVSIAVAAAAALLAGMCTGLVLRYARRRLIDQVNERSSHAVPTPRGGGLGLVVGLVLSVLPFLVATSAWPAVGAVLAVLAMAAVGWWDDHADLSPRFRLGLQFLLVLVALTGVGWLSQASLGPWTMSAPWWVVGPILVVGGVWMVNLTNFMDGIDGIAGSQGLVAGAGLSLLIAQAGGDPAWVVLGAGLAGASSGFLWWNAPPAKIFMGDVGSTALGLAFAVLVVAAVRVRVPLDAALLPILPFICDATATLIRRAWRRERLSQAHRSHLYQRLARAWGSHRLVTLLWCGWAALGVILALAEQSERLSHGLGLLICLLVFAVLVGIGRRVAPA